MIIRITIPSYPTRFGSLKTWDLTINWLRPVLISLRLLYKHAVGVVLLGHVFLNFRFGLPVNLSCGLDWISNLLCCLINITTSLIGGWWVATKLALVVK